MCTSWFETQTIQSLFRSSCSLSPSKLRVRGGGVDRVCLECHMRARSVPLYSCSPLWAPLPLVQNPLSRCFFIFSFFFSSLPVDLCFNSCSFHTCPTLSLAERVFEGRGGMIYRSRGSFISFSTGLGNRFLYYVGLRVYWVFVEIPWG